MCDAASFGVDTDTIRLVSTLPGNLVIDGTVEALRALVHTWLLSLKFTASINSLLHTLMMMLITMKVQTITAQTVRILSRVLLNVGNSHQFDHLSFDMTTLTA